MPVKSNDASPAAGRVAARSPWKWVAVCALGLTAVASLAGACVVVREYGGGLFPCLLVGGGGVSLLAAVAVLFPRVRSAIACLAVHSLELCLELLFSV